MAAPSPRGTVTKTTTRVQMIHQAPFASLDTRMRVGETIAEGPRAYGLWSAPEAVRNTRDLLDQVGLEGAYADRLPHQFSGGQRQRIAIARSLAMQPDLLVLYEAVASLDVSIQAQVLNLFMDLGKRLALTAIFISHDLGVVRHVCDRVAIMYLGRLVDATPLLPGAVGLGPGPRHRARCIPTHQGEIPSPLNTPSGDAFHRRCPHAGPRCRAEIPMLGHMGAQQGACHLHHGAQGKTQPDWARPQLAMANFTSRTRI
ncbi:ATP-binding cassette domain-containing protein [Salipiger sp. 1_MG-2023]|uniref:ATP-binding cassette domain-containing protein n=1 Tax=Salipiger sp. 1_MG-2023 TaxID=3062665 RepID=UPI0026E47E70|nr:ATP-binding cassette domain-containing protein [Salipiger sp. 1_MG-2023]MDO6587502.1 ATP-binding cassette domain-containing protein [Salipiger sp. 1_MG-2023]